MEHRLVSTGGEKFLPFARSRIKALRATGLAYATQSFEVDGAKIRVQIEPGHEHIKIEASAVDVWLLVRATKGTTTHSVSGDLGADPGNPLGTVVTTDTSVEEMRTKLFRIARSAFLSAAAADSGVPANAVLMHEGVAIWRTTNVVTETWAAFGGGGTYLAHRIEDFQNVLDAAPTALHNVAVHGKCWIGQFGSGEISRYYDYTFVPGSGSSAVTTTTARNVSSYIRKTDRLDFVSTTSTTSNNGGITSSSSGPALDAMSLTPTPTDVWAAWGLRYHFAGDPPNSWWCLPFSTAARFACTKAGDPITPLLPRAEGSPAYSFDEVGADLLQTQKYIAVRVPESDTVIGNDMLLGWKVYSSRRCPETTTIQSRVGAGAGDYGPISTTEALATKDTANSQFGAPGEEGAVCLISLPNDTELGLVRMKNIKNLMDDPFFYPAIHASAYWGGWRMQAKVDGN